MAENIQESIEDVVVRMWRNKIRQTFTDLAHKKITDATARNSIHTWFTGLTEEEKNVFRQSRIRIEEEFNWLKGTLETISQEIPALFVN